MAKELKPQICVIGADVGGLSVAAAAAAFGAPAVLIEEGRMGEECVKKTGVVPAKALIAAAERVHAVRNGARFGMKAVRFGVDFAAVRAHMHEVIQATAPNSARERIAGLGVRVIAGTGRFTDAETVTVGDVAIKANHFVIATGAAPFIPTIPGLLDTPHLTTETVSDLTECPRHLIIVGGGAAGLELAQAFRRLGSDVTVLEAATVLLPDEDPECAVILLDALHQEGVKLRTGIEVTGVQRALAKVRVAIATPAGPETIEGSHLLVAAGRRPNCADLNLEAAGVRYWPHGIVVDQRLRTTNKRVYALGEVTGAPALSHLANYHAGLVIRHALFHVPIRVEPREIPRVIYTDPELAHVGLREEEARAHSGAIRLLRWPYRENDRAQAERTTNGHIKVITDPGGAILGVTIVGAQASEAIATWTLAISQKLNIRAFASLVAPYPTYAEMGKRAAITYFSRGLTSPRMRRIIGWLRRLG